MICIFTSSSWLAEGDACNYACEGDNAVIDLQISDEEEHLSDMEDEELQLDSMEEESDESEEEMTLLRIEGQIHEY